MPPNLSPSSTMALLDQDSWLFLGVVSLSTLLGVEILKNKILKKKSNQSCHYSALQWLPIALRIKPKFPVMAFNTLHGLAPADLLDSSLSTLPQPSPVQLRRVPYCSSNSPSSFLPQGLCTCYPPTSLPGSSFSSFMSQFKCDSPHPD